jgi:hypothetical protein
MADKPLLELKMDLSEFLKEHQELKEKAERLTKAAAADLSATTFNKVKELSQSKLKSRREFYDKHLSYAQVNEYTWVVHLDAKAMWIEEGMAPHEMIDDLLKSPKAKTSKDGSKYLSIPFKHNKGPTQQTPAQKSLTETIKKTLNEMNKGRPAGGKIPYGKLETNPDGSPKLGLLHKFNITDSPKKTANVPGQGKGPIGAPMQGPTGTPFLKGVRIYQRQNAQGKVERTIMTFRTVSSKHKGTGRWFHPGLEPVKFLDQAFDWAMKEWETKIKPALMDAIVSGP